MSRKSNIEVKESIETLENLYRKEKNHRLRTRIKCLILLKANKFKGQLELSNYLGVDYATVKRWLKQYREEGLLSLTVFKSSGNRKSGYATKSWTVS